jgi:hypothetical protein
MSKEITNEINQKKILTFFLWLGLFLIMGLRAETVGNDLMRYLDHFQDVKHIDTFKTRTETGYMLFLNLLDFFNIGRQGYIIIVSFIISYSFAWFISKYSNNIGLSFFLHLTIGLFTLTLSGIRQSLAISIILLAIHFAIKRKLIYYLITVFIAVLFHMSAIIFLPAYLLLNTKIKGYKIVLLYSLLIVVTIFFVDFLFSRLNYFAPEKYIKIYLDNHTKTGMNFLSVLFKIALPVTVLLFWKFQKRKIKDISSIDTSFFILSLVSIIFAILSLKLSIIERLSYYYDASLIILIPNAIQQFKNKNNLKIIRFVIIVIATLYFTTSTIGGILKIDDYSFWRG